MAASSQPTIDLTPLSEFSLDLDQYTGLWAVDEERFAVILEQVSMMDLAAHVRANQTIKTEAPLGLIRQNNATIARVDIRGVMTKRGSSLSDAGSTVKIRQTIRTLANDAVIDGIIIRFDSPGGTVAGIADLAREIRSAASRKPLVGFMEDTCASAAYWAASQCSTLYANAATALIGSIGTYTRLVDRSDADGKRGVKTFTIRTGPHKGVGNGGKVTPEQLAAVQELIDSIQAEFTSEVATGRGMPIAVVEDLATGQTWTAREAQALGLVDGIKTFDEVLSSIQSQISQRKRGTRMSTDSTQTTPVAATAAELRQAFPTADADFLFHQAEKNATVAQVSTAWSTELQSQLAKANEATAAAKVETSAALKAATEAEALAEKAKQSNGVKPLGTGKAGSTSEGFDGDAVAEFSNQIRERVKGGMSRPAAVKATVKANKNLHQAYLLATNGPGAAEAINSHFE
jgi:signal peptide peptidase SppA